MQHQNHSELTSHQITSLHPIPHPSLHLPTHLRTSHQSKQTLRLSLLLRAIGAWPWSIAQSNSRTAKNIKTYENIKNKTNNFGLNPGFSNVSCWSIWRELVVELVVTIRILVSPALEGTNLHLANHPHLKSRANMALTYKHIWQKSCHVSQVNWHAWWLNWFFRFTIACSHFPGSAGSDDKLGIAACPKSGSNPNAT